MSAEDRASSFFPIHTYLQNLYVEYANLHDRAIQFSIWSPMRARAHWGWAAI